MLFFIPCRNETKIIQGRLTIQITAIKIRYIRLNSIPIMLKLSNLKKNIAVVNCLLNDNGRKSIPKITGEVISMAIRQRCIPIHYLTSYVYKKDRENIYDFFPNKFLNEIRSKFNDRNVAEVLENKLYFNLFYGQFGISLPKILMYNHKKMFVIGDKCFQIDDLKDFKSALISLTRNNDSDYSLFIKRTYGTYGGDGVYKISLWQLLNDSDMMASLYQEVSKKGFLFQETIRQHADLDVLNPSCINTIRFDTFIDNTGKIDIISAHIRMSINNLHVDNIGSGGCAVAINLNTGQLRKHGYRPFVKSGGKLLTEHPATKTVFDRFAIPHFEKAKALVLKAASLMPGLRLIGWDVGIADSGPVLIEGNSDYDIHGSDIMYGGYRANPVFRKALEEIHYFKESDHYPLQQPVLRVS